MATYDEIKDKERHDRKSRKMIADHKKKKIALIPFAVPGDPCRTVFMCKTEEEGKRKVADYKREHQSFWL